MDKGEEKGYNMDEVLLSSLFLHTVVSHSSATA